MQSRDIQYEITTPIQKLAVELYKTATITDNKSWHTNGQLDDVDWNEWFMSSATMPLSGPGFVTHWEKLAEVAFEFVKASGAVSPENLND